MRPTGAAGRCRRTDCACSANCWTLRRNCRGSAPAGRARAVDVFSWESVAAQTVAVYERAIERTPERDGSHADRRLRPARYRARHHGDRRGLRCRPACVRGVPARRRRRSPSTRMPRSSTTSTPSCRRWRSRARRRPRRQAEVVKGDALDLPYADGTFDCVIASEILEHVPAGRRAPSPNWSGCSSPAACWRSRVPRWLPEKMCWLLSDEYHANEGGHIRIYRADELRDKITARRHGLRRTPITRTHCTRRSGG